MSGVVRIVAAVSIVAIGISAAAVFRHDASPTRPNRLPSPDDPSAAAAAALGQRQSNSGSKLPRPCTGSTVWVAENDRSDQRDSRAAFLASKALYSEPRINSADSSAPDRINAVALTDRTAAPIFGGSQSRIVRDELPSLPELPTTFPRIDSHRPSRIGDLPPRARIDELTHRIADGDTIESIAERYFGTPRAAEQIVRANADWLSDARILPVGRLLRIPQGQQLKASHSEPARPSPEKASAVDSPPIDATSSTLERQPPVCPPTITRTDPPAESPRPQGASAGSTIIWPSSNSPGMIQLSVGSDGWEPAEE